MWVLTGSHTPSSGFQRQGWALITLCCPFPGLPHSEFQTVLSACLLSHRPPDCVPDQQSTPHPRHSKSSQLVPLSFPGLCNKLLKHASFHLALYLPLFISIGRLYPQPRPPHSPGLPNSGLHSPDHCLLSSEPLQQPRNQAPHLCSCVPSRIILHAAVRIASPTALLCSCCLCGFPGCLIAPCLALCAVLLSLHQSHWSC